MCYISLPPSNPNPTPQPYQSLPLSFMEWEEYSSLLTLGQVHRSQLLHYYVWFQSTYCGVGQDTLL